MTSPSAVDRRRTQSRADARRAILDACESLLLEVGYEGFSIRRLVERCGYTAPTIYHYFRDKTGLIDALLEERLLRSLVEALRAVAAHPDPLVETRARYEAFAQWGCAHPDQYQLLMERRTQDATPLPSGEEALALLQTPLERLQASGRLAAADAEMFRQAAWACLHGLIALPPMRPDIEWQPDLIARAVEAVLRGFLGEAVVAASFAQALPTPQPAKNAGPADSDPDRASERTPTTSS